MKLHPFALLQMKTHVYTTKSEIVHLMMLLVFWTTGLNARVSEQFNEFYTMCKKAAAA
jgi:hypothetical protein